MAFAKFPFNDENVKNVVVWKRRHTVDDDGDDNHDH